MAKRDNPAKSNAIAKAGLAAALQNPSVSDFRKESKTFQFTQTQRVSLDSLEDYANVLLEDLDTGHMGHQDVIARMLVVEKGIISPKDIEIRREELELKMEKRAKAMLRLNLRRDAISEMQASE